MRTTPGYIYIKEDAGTLNAAQHHFYQDLEKKSLRGTHVGKKKRLQNKSPGKTDRPFEQQTLMLVKLRNAQVQISESQ